ncbi:MAG: AMP-binding enzyme [Paracoccaceae bacterium]
MDANEPIRFAVGPCTEQEIIEFCRETQAAYKCPRKVQFGSDVPKTSTGKKKPPLAKL